MSFSNSISLTEDIESRSEVTASSGDHAFTVLVVEDDPVVRLIICSMLEDLGHATCDVASAERALEILASNHAIDLVVTDFSMKEMTGGELIERIWREHVGLPVILATGDPASAAGVDARVLIKPFFQEDLRCAIAETMTLQTA